jgi:hypothetical protein
METKFPNKESRLLLKRLNTQKEKWTNPELSGLKATDLKSLIPASTYH